MSVSYRRARLREPPCSGNRLTAKNLGIGRLAWRYRGARIPAASCGRDVPRQLESLDDVKDHFVNRPSKLANLRDLSIWQNGEIRTGPARRPSCRSPLSS